MYTSLPEQPPHTESQAAVVKRVILFFTLTFKVHDYVEARKLLSSTYKQHHPMLADGPDSVFAFATKQREKANGRSPEFHFKRILVDGDFVMTHRHIIRWPGDRGLQLFDMFRMQEGLFTEHWDSFAKEVPEDSQMQHSNGLF